MTEFVIFLSYKDPNSVRLYEWMEKKFPNDPRFHFVSIHKQKDLVADYDITRVPLLVSENVRLEGNDILRFLKNSPGQKEEKPQATAPPKIPSIYSTEAGVIKAGDPNNPGNPMPVLEMDGIFSSPADPPPRFNSIQENSDTFTMDKADIDRQLEFFQKSRTDFVDSIESKNKETSPRY